MAAGVTLPTAGPRDASRSTQPFLPCHLFRYILATSARHQIALSLLTVIVFLLELPPLEMQRRIVNGLVDGREYSLIILLGGAYLAAVVMHGSTKLALNIYRGWVGERATRDLRRRIDALLHQEQSAVESGGVGVAVMIAEVEPIGGFLAESVSEPLLQAGVLVSVLAYLFTLQPYVALAMVAIFSPQLVFVPMLQRAINRRAASRVRTLRAVGTDIITPSNSDGNRRRNSEARIDRIFELDMGIFRLKFTMNYLMNLTHHVEVVGALLFGGWCVLHGRTEIGTVVAFISGIGRLNDPWGDLVNYFRDVTSTRIKYRLLADAVDTLARGEVPKDLLLTVE